MKRRLALVALCLPLAGLAIASDDAGTGEVPVLEIRVSQADLAECRQTLARLDDRAVYDDDGTWVPSFFVRDDLPDTVCVAEA